VVQIEVPTMKSFIVLAALFIPSATVAAGCYPAEQILTGLAERGMKLNGSGWMNGGSDQARVAGLAVKEDGSQWELYSWGPDDACFIASGTTWARYDLKRNPLPAW
jgi:hypothetical protein